MAGVISLVPSWTETLIACGVPVIGRTRYCIHPKDRVPAIPILGGTKRLDWSKWQHLGAELVVMDRDENSLEIAEQCPFPQFSSHVRTLADVSRDLETLGCRLQNDPLLELAERWRSVTRHPPADQPLAHLPAVLRWIQPPVTPPQQLLYLIWRKPWMAASTDSFIGSMLHHLGFGWAVVPRDELYPTVDLNQYDPETTLLLLSSEPFPFEQHLDKVAELPFPMALVDGEAYSWYGLRTLQFLETRGSHSL